MQKNFVKVWGDVVDFKSLTISILVTLILTIFGYYIVNNQERVIRLFMGLAMSSLGFIISSIFIRPKRIVIEE